MIAVSLAVVLPVAGTVLALAALALLRAGDLAHSAADQRSPFVTAAAFPFYVIRALLTTVLLAPLAIAVAVVAGGAAFVVAPTDTLARALSVAAGALIAFYGYGPGSGKPRRQLSRMFSAVIRNSGVRAVALVAMGALALAGSPPRSRSGCVLAARLADRVAAAPAIPARGVRAVAWPAVPAAPVGRVPWTLAVASGGRRRGMGRRAGHREAGGG